MNKNIPPPEPKNTLAPERSKKHSRYKPVDVKDAVQLRAHNKEYAIRAYRTEKMEAYVT